MKEIHLIYNPISGMAGSGRAAKALARLLKKDGWRVEIHATKRRGHATKLAADLKKRADRLVTIGGDGTINEVVNGLGDFPLPLGIVPRGAANVLAKELGLPRAVSKVKRIIEEGCVAKLDVGLADKQRFLLMAGVGLDARATVEVHSRRTGSVNFFNYAAAVLKTIAVGHRFPKLHIVVDGEEVKKDVRLAIVGNVRSYGGPFEFTSFARPDDALLDICLFEKTTQFDLLRFLWASFTKTHLNYSDVHYMRGKEITITADKAVPYQLDGDPAGTLPAHFTVLPQALPVIVDKAWKTLGENTS
jgi:YegS/Rv2252/BmrU family lipid kinase